MKKSSLNLEIRLNREEQTKFFFYDFDHAVYRGRISAVFEDIHRDMNQEKNTEILSAQFSLTEKGKMVKFGKVENFDELNEIIQDLREIYEEDY